MITGSVMDMSTGKPNTPAVSRRRYAKMMDYRIRQNATLLNNPPSPRRVPVTLMAVDQKWKPNRHWQHDKQC